MRNQTPLGVHILTTTHDDPSMADLLLQYESDPNASIDKSTILHVALDKELYQIANILVRYGARLDTKDEQGRMVFDKVEPQVLKMLLSKVAHPPVWVPDNERKGCMECSKKFSALGARRHHCRYCGRLLCSHCTSNSISSSKFPFTNTQIEKKQKKQRVCKTCFDIFLENKG
jgi:hypothetical protein